MADAPVVFKRTKPKHIPRTRDWAPGTPATDGESEGADSTDSPSTLATKLKKKARVKPKSRLSFGGDEEVRCRTAV